MASETTDKYAELTANLAGVPFISPAQIERWVTLQRTIDAGRDYLIRAVPDAQFNLEEAQKILSQRTYTLIFFGGTGVGKSTLINALLGRSLLPAGAVTAVTGTIIYLEQAAEGEAETLTLSYWEGREFAERVRRLCQLAQLAPFNITNDGERDAARQEIGKLIKAAQDVAKTEQDEYFEILLDCIGTYENHIDIYKANGAPAPQVYTLDNADAYKHLREDGFKGSDQRQIRLVKSATFRIHPRTDQPNLLMNGYLRIVDVPGLGAGMRLHEAITLEEMKREDAMIVLVTDAGRQRVDEMKSLSAVNWIKENRLRGLRGADLDEAAAKIFLVVNGGNIRQAFDRLTSGLPQAEREIKEVTRHIAPNYWDRYRERRENRPYFLVMPPSAVYVTDPDNAPHEFQTETERILKAFADQLGPVDADPLNPDTKAALLKLSEVPALRESLIDFIRTERIRSQLREVESRVRTALDGLKAHYAKQLAAHNVQPPFDISWEALQERRFENLLQRHQKELPRVFHTALVDVSQRYNDDVRFRRLLRPTLGSIKDRVQEIIKAEIESLLENYGTEHWDDRDVTYDNLIWGTTGIELPIKRILYQVELTMQEAVAENMPQLGDVISNELRRTLADQEIKARLVRAGYGQDYTYTLPHAPGNAFSAESAYDALIDRIAEQFRQVCQQATMYELVRPERSVHTRLIEGEKQLGMATNERLLDVALRGVDAVRQEMPAPSAPAAANAAAAPVAPPAEEEIAIRILDEPAPATTKEELGINLLDGGSGGNQAGGAVNENSYAAMLETIAGKTQQVFDRIIDDLFSDDNLLPRLRRLFWLEATRTERDFNNHLIKPMLRQHDRRLHDASLRTAMEPDLESVSDLESLMRNWEGLNQIEMKLY